MAGINPTTSVITSNINGLNAPIKKQRLLDWIQLYVAHKRHISDLKTHIGQKEEDGKIHTMQT